MSIKVMGVDPSSTATGVAVLTGLDVRDLQFCDAVTASSRTELDPDMREWLRKMHDDSGSAAYRRVTSMIRQLRPLIHEHKPDYIVVEIPSGKAGTGSKAGAKSSLAVYGMAAGRILEAMKGMYPDGRVIAVTEREWNRGQGGKEKRGRDIAVLYRGCGYEPAKDKGLDIADAIGIGCWFFQKKALLEAELRGAAPVGTACAIGGN